MTEVPIRLGCPAAGLLLAAGIEAAVLPGMVLVLMVAGAIYLVSQRRNLHKLRTQLEVTRQENERYRQDKNLYAAITSDLINLVSMAVNAVRTPALRSGNKDAQGVLTFVERAVVLSLNYLNALSVFQQGMPPQDAPIMLAPFFRSCMEGVRFHAEQRRLAMTIASDIPDSYVVRAQAPFLESIIGHFAMTTITCTHPGTTLFVRLQNEDDLVTLSIQGELEQEAADILRKERLAEGALPPHAKEVGFSMIRKAAQIYGGNLDIAAQGASYVLVLTLRLPPAPSAGNVVTDGTVAGVRQQEPGMPLNILPGDAPRILFADGNPMSRSLIGGILGTHCHLALHLSGTDAWNSLQDVHAAVPDLIICEYSLPLLGGQELLRKCQDSPLLQDIPFVFLLAAGEESLQDDLIQQGAAACLRKPFTPQEFVRLVFSIISISRKARHSVLAQIHKAVNAPGNTGRQEISPSQVSMPDAGTMSLTSRQYVLFATTGLSKREQQIAVLISAGKSDKEIAAALGISPATVATHNKKLFKKLDIHSRVELMNKVR